MASNTNTNMNAFVGIAAAALFVALVYSTGAFDGVKDRRRRRRRGKKKNVSTNRNYSGAKLPGHITRELEKERRRLDKMSDLCMKSAMYDNVRMYDPQGEVLCTISLKKAHWYVNKELADWITVEQLPSVKEESDRRNIQLRFEPKARSNRNSQYVTADKKNQCVVCGAKQFHIRHYIVPFVYRCLFPHEYKSHMSHDIVALCAKCHVHCSRETHFRMNDLESQHQVQPQFIIDKSREKVKKCATALLRHQKSMPDDKVNEMKSVVWKYFLSTVDGESSSNTELGLYDELLSTDQLKNASEIEFRSPNPEYIPGPELVVNNLHGDHNKIADFVRDWRIFFVATMSPRFLPNGWSVEYAVKCGESKS